MAVTGRHGAMGRAAGRSTVDQFKSGFFDRDAIVRSMDRLTAKVLSKFGAFTRTSAITSIRYREAASAPGSPPSAHRSAMRAKTNRRTGVMKVQPSSPLRDFLFFAYERDRQAVLIGPAKTNQVFFEGQGKPVTGTVPQVLEEGGSIGIVEWFRGGRWQRADLRSRRRLEGRPTRFRTAHVRARPFMAPAFQANLGIMMGWWEDGMQPA